MYRKKEIDVLTVKVLLQTNLKLVELDELDERIRRRWFRVYR